MKLPAQPRFTAAMAVPIIALLCSTARALEGDALTTSTERPAPPPSAATETPRVAYTHTAFGASAGTVGGAGFGESRGDFRPPARPRLGGGVRVWWSPIDRLTLLADGERRDNDRFAPSASLQVRILGDREQGWALALLGRYKAEGFAELGGETEFAVLGSYSRRHIHLDANTVLGVGFEEKESDGEILGRAGYDVTSFLRLGGEGRVRSRIGGAVKLPGGRDWDVTVGPQVLGHYEAFFGAVTGGPSNVGTTSDVGWAVVATFGGVAF